MNRQNTISCIGIMLMLFLPERGFCQQQKFVHYAVEDGISQSAIICLFQDSEGFLWIGTQNGLNKFDGYNFESYYYDPNDTNSISNSWIFNITEDENACLWIGTKGGLNKFDKKTALFSRIPLPNELPGRSNSFVYGLTSDESNIYINQIPVLSVLNYRTGALESYESGFKPDETLYDLGFPVLKDSRGLVWMGSTEGLAYFDPGEKKFRIFTNDESNPNTISPGRINALAEDRQNQILVGTTNGLNILDPLTGKITRCLHEPNRQESLSHNHITSVLQDHTGTIWVGTSGGGLNKMVPQDMSGTVRFTHLRSGPDNEGSINHDIILSLCEDHSYNLWVGALAGINKTDLKKKSIHSYSKSEDPGSMDLLDNIIASVHEDREDRIWIGTWGKGLTILNRQTGEVANYAAEYQGDRHIPENHVHVIFEDSRGNVWLGTRDGICIFDDRTQRFVPAGEYLNMPGFNFFSNNRVYCMIENSAHDLWIGTGNGIFILNTLAKSSRTIRAQGDSLESVSSNLVYSILEDRDLDLWVATANGLNRFDHSGTRKQQYFNVPGSSNSLGDNYTISLCEDRDGNIWIGTSTGVNRFDKMDSLFTWYNTSHGLPSNIIYDIIEDGKGNLWFSTGGGLAMKNPDVDAGEVFIIIDELRGREFNIKAVHRAADGEMFFGGIEGLVSFYPDSLRKNTYIPPVRITAFEKESGGKRQKLNVYQDEIVLSFKDYSFTIEFSALDFTDPSKNLYSYQMLGISDRWIDIGQRRFVHFTNLSPGKYTFTVKGSNNDAVWNTEGSNIRIKILPPWWRSKYAYICYLIFMVLTIVAIIKLRERNLVLEKKILEDKITERTKEIAEQKGKLEESEAKLKSTISSIDDLVFVLDQNGIFQEFYNLGKHPELFRESESYINKHYSKVGYPHLVVRQLSMAFEELKRKDTVQEFDYCLDNDGEMCWFNAKVSPRRNMNGELTGIIIVARDITERKESEVQVRKQKDELKELNAMKDRFFSILAHDLKNPFSSLHSMSELAIENYKDLEEDDKLKMLQNIHKSAELIYNLLENLLTWSKSQRGRIDYSPDRFNLSKVIEVNINLHQVPAGKKGVVLSARVEDDLQVYGDREMINTVVRNLVNNAVKFSNKGDKVEVHITEQDKMYRVLVRDQGIGISAANMNKLFRIDEKFKSKGTAGETGTGLGLVLCKDFVEKNGGRIWVESKEGSGADFFFTIPRYTPGPE